MFKNFHPVVVEVVGVGVGVDVVVVVGSVRIAGVAPVTLSL